MPDESSGFNIDAEDFDLRQSDNSALRLIHESKSGYARIFYCERNGRRFAIKCLRPDLADNPIYRELLRKEYDIGHRLYHHNIVAVNAIEERADTGLSIEMEYVDGVTLGDYLAAHPSLAEHEAEDIVRQITDALTYIHGHHLTHRDLKPSNILITHAEKMVKIIDFGLSNGDSFTRFKLSGGTQQYSAPEQLEGNAESDARADVYAVGRIMLDFNLKNRAWNRVARQCLAKDPAKRPAKAADILPTVHRASRRHAATIIGIALLIASLTSLLIFLPRRDGKTNPEPIVAATDAPPAPVDTLDAPAEPPEGETNVELVSAVTTPTPTVEEAASEPQTVADPAEKSTEKESEPEIDDANLPLEEAAYRHLTAICKRHWQRHIATIDTMRNIATIRLATVGYWRHLSKEEFSQWLETRITKDTPYFEQMMELARKTVTQFQNENKSEEHHAWTRANKRGVNQAIIDFTQCIGNDVYEHRRLLENGTWAIHSWSESTRRALQ